MTNNTTTLQDFDPSELKVVEEIYVTRRILMDGAEVEYRFFYKFEGSTRNKTLVTTHRPTALYLRDQLLAAGYTENSEQINGAEVVTFRRIGAQS